MVLSQQIAQMTQWASALLDSTYNGTLAGLPNVEQYRTELRPSTDSNVLARQPQATLDRHYGVVKTMYDQLMQAQGAEKAAFGRLLSADEVRRLKRPH